MTKRKKQITDDYVTSGRVIRYFDPISDDLIINILSRLPVKSIAKCRCVSKLWSSIIRRPNHNRLFPIKSPATPKLLFISEGRGIQQELFFYSSPHPQNPDNNSSLVHPRHLTNSVTDYYRLCPPLAGLLCRQQFGENDTFAVISNPVTGEYVTTPKVTTEGFESKAEIYFGYDPIDKNFKVLCITWSLSDDDDSHKYQVLTLGTGNLLWRNIQCCTFHYPQADDDKAICINGVLYYTSTINTKKRMIVCFNVRSEKISFIDIPDEYLAREIFYPLILIDYKGELGVIHCDVLFHRLALWVLKDAEEENWSQHFYEMPHQMDLPRLTTAPVYSAGMIGNDEIVLYHKYTQNPFYIFCYNLEKNVITSVGIEIPTLGWVEYHQVETFSNFLEDVKLVF